MIKINFTFASVSTSRRYSHNYRSVKKLCRSGKKHLAANIAARCKQLIAGATQPFLKASAVLGIAITMNTAASAQTCNIFYNADAANPIHGKGLPKSREPYFVDIDGDGDYDCYVLDYYYSYTSPRLYKNVGTKAVPAYVYEPDSSGFAGNPDFASSNVAFVDIDGDGDYDCFLAQAYIGNFGGTRIKYFENTGTATHPVFVENEAKNPLASQYGFYFISFTFADVDGDGDLDVYVNNGYETYTLINEGTKTQATFVVTQYQLDANAGDRAYYDWNHDGLLDYFNMDSYYGFHYYKNIGPKSNPKYVIDDADGPSFLNGDPHQFTNINGDSAPEVFNRDGGFSTLAVVPVVTASRVSYNGKTYEKLSVSPDSKTYTYQWYLNGEPVAHATHPFIVALKNGSYTATITDSCGTGVSHPTSVTANQSLAETAGDNEAIASINAITSPTAKAYPNPFVSEFTIQLPPAKTAAISTIQVMDAAGRILLTQTTSATSVTIGRTLPAGAYMVQVLQKGTMVYHTTIVKQ